MAAPQLYRRSARAGPLRLFHGSSASEAEPTACSTSCAVPRGISAMTSDASEGLRSETQSVAALDCHCPAMKWRRRKVLAGVAVMRREDYRARHLSPIARREHSIYDASI